jgi:hypothetical protein
MKKLLILISSAILLGCSSIKKLDTTGFHSENNTIFYEKDTVATLSAIEYSIDNGKYVKEMTFKLLNMKHADKVQNLLYFVHKRHKDWEIELDYPITNFKINKGE